MNSVDKLLSGEHELRSRFIHLAADPGVLGDMLFEAFVRAGIPAKRLAVFNWRKPFRAGERHRPGTLASRVTAAVLKLGRAWWRGTD